VEKAIMEIMYVGMYWNCWEVVVLD
jgi:hypothetical protein